MLSSVLPPSLAAKLLVQIFLRRQLRVLGGKGSGNWGHSGRKGEVGGSASADFNSAIEQLKAVHGDLVPANVIFTKVDPDPEAVTAYNSLSSVLGPELGEPSNDPKSYAETVPVTSLIAVQEEVDLSTLVEKESGVDTQHSSKLPVVVKLGAKMFLVDGHHRAAIDILKGKKSLKVEVYDFREPKTLGGKGSGNWSHEGRPGERGGSGAGTTPQKVRSARSRRALKHFKPVHAEAQRHAEANELEVRSMIGGTRTDDNLPVDVITTIDGKLKGVEVKTMINNTNDKITMRAAAIEKKQVWARSNHATVHTVVVDDRGRLGNTGYSGHRLYYRKGYGSFRLESMIKVTDAAHLKRLMSK